MQGSPRAKRSPSGDAVFADDVEEGVGRLELHLSSVKLLETSDEEDTTTGDYYVRSRRFEVLRCLPCDSYLTHDAGGGFFFDFELFRTASGPSRRVRGTAVASMASSRDRAAATPSMRSHESLRGHQDAVDAMAESTDRDAPRR